MVPTSQTARRPRLADVDWEPSDGELRELAERAWATAAPFHITPAIPVFLDTEFTSLLDPHLLSVGLVTLDGREHYAELNMESEFGRARLAITPRDVRDNILD